MPRFHFSLCVLCRLESGEGDMRGKGPGNAGDVWGDGGNPGHHLKEVTPPPPMGRSGSERASGSQISPRASLDSPRPGLLQGRAGVPRPLGGVPDTTQRLTLRKLLGPRGLKCPCPLPRTRHRTFDAWKPANPPETKAGLLLQTQTTNSFAFSFLVFFFPLLIQAGS